MNKIEIHWNETCYIHILSIRWLRAVAILTKMNVSNSIGNVVFVLYSAQLQLFLVNAFPIFRHAKVIHRTIKRGQFSLRKHFKVFANSFRPKLTRLKWRHSIVIANAYLSMNAISWDLSVMTFFARILSRDFMRMSCTVWSVCSCSVIFIQWLPTIHLCYSTHWCLCSLQSRFVYFFFRV